MPPTKTARLDLRLVESQRADIERAAALSGSTITGWAVTTLTTAAHRELAAAAVTTVPAQDWEAFVAALDAPLDPATLELLARRPVWDEA
ncbi:MAG: DUF1778 domain-containing protein [Bifidobacteriaceae bacterium]|jgi:uncharacterized protein (DUF1778 family)|nr:DUF1778 domain-containing protein [Bifidobacteriaceae bacterium]